MNEKEWFEGMSESRRRLLVGRVNDLYGNGMKDPKAIGEKLNIPDYYVIYILEIIQKAEMTRK